MRIAVKFTTDRSFKANLTTQAPSFVARLSEQLRILHTVPIERGRIFAPKFTEGSREFAPHFGAQYGVASEVPIYDGIYRVRPDTEAEQTLATAQKQLLDDIVVEKIPFFEVSNNSGGNTVYIGSEV